MIKINYKNIEKDELSDDISIYNIKIADKYKKKECFELGCVSWLKNDPNRNYQQLEQLLRYLNVDSHLIAKPVQNTFVNLNFINDSNLEYIVHIECKFKVDCINELTLYHDSYESNYKCLKTNYLMIKENNKISIDSISNNINTIIDKETEYNKKIINSSLKFDFIYYNAKESINFIIDDLIQKHNKEPNKIICGEINNKKVNAIMLNNEIASPIGWIETDTDYQLIDFRTIKIEK